MHEHRPTGFGQFKNWLLSAFVDLLFFAGLLLLLVFLVFEDAFLYGQSSVSPVELLARMCAVSTMTVLLMACASTARVACAYIGIIILAIHGQLQLNAHLGLNGVKDAALAVIYLLGGNGAIMSGASYAAFVGASAVFTACWLYILHRSIPSVTSAIFAQRGTQGGSHSFTTAAIALALLQAAMYLQSRQAEIVAGADAFGVHSHQVLTLTLYVGLTTMLGALPFVLAGYALLQRRRPMKSQSNTLATDVHQ